MRHILIDTDTASDDAVALLMALREPKIHVEAITVVAGNCPLDTCVKNALVTAEKAGTYTPPVYAGMAKPLMRPLFTAEFVHGDDGMGNMDLPDPTDKNSLNMRWMQSSRWQPSMPENWRLSLWGH